MPQVEEVRVRACALCVCCWCVARGLARSCDRRGVVAVPRLFFLFFLAWRATATRGVVQDQMPDVPACAVFGGCVVRGVVALSVLFFCVLCRHLCRFALALHCLRALGLGVVVFLCWWCVRVCGCSSILSICWLALLRVARPMPACASSPPVCAFCCGDCERRTPTTALTTMWCGFRQVRVAVWLRHDVYRRGNARAIAAFLVLMVEWDEQV